MLSTIGFLNIIILLGAVQGFIVSVLLFFSSGPKPANRILAVLIFLMALASLNLYLINNHELDTSRVFVLIQDFVPLIIAMPIGPLIFFYVKAVSHPEFKLTRKNRIHFYPVLIDLVPQMTAIIYVIGFLSGIFRKNNPQWGNFIDTYNVYADIPRWISISIYLWLSARYISNLPGDLHPGVNQEPKKIRWMNQFIRVFLVFQVIWLAYLIPYIIPKYTDALLNGVGWYPVYVPIAVLIYWLGLKGLMVKYQTGRANAKEERKNIPLDQGLIHRTIDLLTKSMEEEKLYLQVGLTLAHLAGHLGISQKTLSAVLNQHLHKSFNEFINEYRIEAVKQRFQNPALDYLTLAGIAMECGFNSQATFQRTFKQLTGCSPSEYKRDLAEIF
jgi:AraC-like DNA-binding protein